MADRWQVASTLYH